MAKSKSTRTKRLKFFFFLYCAFMVWLLFFRSGGWIEGLSYEQQLRQNINLQPFLTIGNYWKVLCHRSNQQALIHSIINLGGNIFLFIPIGVFLPRLYPKLRNYFRFICACFGIIFLVDMWRVSWRFLSHDDFIAKQKTTAIQTVINRAKHRLFYTICCRASL